MPFAFTVIITEKHPQTQIANLRGGDTFLDDNGKVKLLCAYYAQNSVADPGAGYFYVVDLTDSVAAVQIVPNLNVIPVKVIFGTRVP